jgi:hypothetical protein
MWQLSWMLGLLPSWFWTLVLICGVLGILASWVLKFVPFVSTYRLPIQVGSILALLVGVYFQGFNSNEEKWQAKVKELEAKIAVAEAASKTENVIIKEKVVYKDRIIREKGKQQIEYIDRIVKGDTEFITKDMSESERAAFKKKQEELEYAIKMCPVPRIIVEEHNKAAINLLNEAAKGEKK